MSEAKPPIKTPRMLPTAKTMANYIHCLTGLANFTGKIPCPCVLCHAPSPYGICNSCARHYLGDPVTRCRCCGHDIPKTHTTGQSNLCGACLARPPAFDTTIVATDYVPPFDFLIHQLKFGHQLALAPLMGKLINNAIERQADTDWQTPDILIAVPLGKARLIERGFNQSHEIARTLARSIKLPLHTGLIYRNRETAQQSTISFSERKQNVHNAFTVSHDALAVIRGKHIGVVDDVMTTGHTLEEIARILKKAGAGYITNFVFARTPSKLLQEN